MRPQAESPSRQAEPKAEERANESRRTGHGPLLRVSNPASSVRQIGDQVYEKTELSMDRGRPGGATKVEFYSIFSMIRCPTIAPQERQSIQ